MITALVHVPRPGEAALEPLADTLAALVGGVAAGLVGDAVVIVPAEHPAVATVAEATGAALLVAPPGTDPWRAGAAVARRDWLLCLVAGDVPAEGWVRAIERFVSRERGAVIGRPRRVGGAPLQRLRRFLGARARRVRAGDVARRADLAAPRAAQPRVRRLAARIDAGAP